MSELIHLVGNETVNINDIILLKAESNYSEVFLESGNKITTSKTLKKFEKKLDYFPFFRTHKSFIINVNHVLEYHPNENTDIILSNNFNVQVSRRRKKEFNKVYNKK